MMVSSRVTRLSAAGGSVLAGVAVMCAAATGPAGAHVGAAARAATSSTVYVSIGSTNWGAVRPVSTATNTAGTPVKVGSDPAAVAITPDSRTAYVTGSLGVTPISTATDTAGAPIPVPNSPGPIAITPDGTTAYVATPCDCAPVKPGTVTPISTATNTAGTPIKVGLDPDAIAITPDGATAYVANYLSRTVTPISTATNAAGTPIPITLGRYSPNPSKIAITPDGKTAYVLSLVPSRVNNNRDILTPVSTATNAAGTPISVGKGAWAIAITP